MHTIIIATPIIIIIPRTFPIMNKHNAYKNNRNTYNNNKLIISLIMIIMMPMINNHDIYNNNRNTFNKSELVLLFTYNESS